MPEEASFANRAGGGGNGNAAHGFAAIKVGNCNLITM